MIIESLLKDLEDRIKYYDSYKGDASMAWWHDRIMLNNQSPYEWTLEEIERLKKERYYYKERT